MYPMQNLIHADTKMIVFIIYGIDRPITYLYDTLHYYEKHLINYPQIKKKLVGTITGNVLA